MTAASLMAAAIVPITPSKVLAQDPAAAEPAIMQSSAYTLYMATARRQKRRIFPTLVSISATSVDQRQAKRQTVIRFRRSAGRENRGQAMEAMRFCAINSPVSSHGQPSIEVTYTAKDRLRDGLTPGLAIAILSDSLIRNVPIDKNSVFAAAINSTGQLQRISDCSNLLDGLARRGHNSVYLSTDNRKALEDIYLEKGPTVLVDYEFFLCDTVEEVRRIVAEDRSAEVAEALDKFAKFRSAVRANPSVMRHRKTPSLLKQVLAAIPNHASAEMLLKYLSNSAKKHISLEHSYSLVMRAYDDFMPTNNTFMRRKEGRSLVGDAAIDELRRVRPRLHAGARDFCDALLSLHQFVERNIERENYPNSLTEEYSERLAAVDRTKVDLETSDALEEDRLL